MYLKAVGYIKLITVHTGLYTFDSMNKVFIIVLCNLFNYARPTWALQDATNECISQIQSAAFTSSSQSEENQGKQNISESLKNALDGQRSFKNIPKMIQLQVFLFRVFFFMIQQMFFLPS